MMPAKTLSETAEELKKGLRDRHALLSRAAEDIGNRLITPGMSEIEAEKARSGVLYHKLLVGLLSEMISAESQMFDLCISAHSKSAEAVKFFDRMKWMFSPKSLFWGIIGVVIAATIYLYDTGGIPR